MLGISDYGAFCAAVLVFLALPGPGTFALLNSTGKGGFRGGAAATAGLIVGDQALLWLAVGGVAALLAAPALTAFVRVRLVPVPTSWESSPRAYPEGHAPPP